MISLENLEWAAGFLEAEGSFQFSKSRHLSVTAAQVEKEPVEKLQQLFGGTIHLYDPNELNHNPVYRWHLVHTKAAGLMMTLFSLLSPKRQGQITESLSEWKSTAVWRKYRTYCPRGHSLSGDNLYEHNGKRYCKECRSYKSMVERGWRTPKWENRLPGEKVNFQCKYGHLMTEDNLYFWKNKRYCKACRTHAEAIKRGWKQPKVITEA